MKTRTAEQDLAIKCPSEKVGVIAGAGTGKTFLLVEKVKSLIARGGNPSRIVLFTFTNRAARQLRDKLNEAGIRGVVVGTFHSVSLQLSPGTVVLGQIEADDVLTQIAIGMGRVLTRSRPPAKGFTQGSIESLRKEINEDPNGELAAAFLSHHAAFGTADFQSLIISLEKKIRSVRPKGDDPDRDGYKAGMFDHVLIDEAQDTDEMQWRIVDAITDAGASLFAVGDPKQQIYEWRGADSQLFIDRVNKPFSWGGKSIPSPGSWFTLHSSFRFGRDISCIHNTLAERIIGSDDQSLGTDLDSQVKLSSCSVVDAVKELLKTPFNHSEIAVLCRSNREVEQAKALLLSEGVAVAECTGFDSPELDLLRFVCNPANMTSRASSLLGLVDHDHKLSGISIAAPEVASAWISTWLRQAFIEPTVEAVLRSIAAPSPALERIVNAVGDLDIRRGLSELTLGEFELQQATRGVTVCTVHQAKGLEFPAVIAVCGFDRGSKEEDRIALVQATRAEEFLYVIDHHTNPGPLARAARKVICNNLIEEELNERQQ